MNNIFNLKRCLDCIINNTNYIDYEIFVVAYMFSESNLRYLNDNYPSVIIVISNEIRGYSENNNLALKLINSQYVVIMNDDIYFNTDVIGQLVKSYETINDSSKAIISPMIVFPNGKIQFCGRGKISWFQALLYEIGFREGAIKNYFLIKKDKVFKSYNISGACFLINANVLRELNYFDEKYFFCPEDVALSTLANKRGYNVYVDPAIKVIHINHGSTNELKPILYPVYAIGICYYYGENSKTVEYILRFMIFIINYLKYVLVSFNNNINKYNKLKYKYLKQYIFTNKTPKEIFVSLYNKRQTV